MDFDVAVVGGGPAGSTIGTLLRKYDPNLRVAIVERETFPRDHVGESQLPGISPILFEMGVWDKVEAAGFPIKVGGTYRWGKTDELWDFEFIPGAKFTDEARPARFEGQRRETAFQVDRAVYDKILLDHARESGCAVFEGTKVLRVVHDGDRIVDLDTSAGGLKAKYYVDASGDAGLIRRAMGIGVESPTALRNIAIWDYWENAEWAVHIGTGGTRVQILSLGWGWLWFIPMSPTRTSIGLVVPAEYYKASGSSSEELYLKAVAQEPLVSTLTANAQREGKLQATKDWSFLADRLVGENWFLAGDSCGFADPILSAGMTLAHTSGRKVAYSILELFRRRLDPDWIKGEYDRGHRRQIRHHIQFADYWYSANGRFIDLKGYCTEIARAAGIEMSADDAFRWLAAGGFALEEPGVARALTYRVGALKFIAQHFAGEKSHWAIAQSNVFRLSLEGATRESLANLDRGRITPVECYRRGGRTLPLTAVYGFVAAALEREEDASCIMERAISSVLAARRDLSRRTVGALVLEAFESLVAEGWVTGTIDPTRPFLNVGMPEESDAFHLNRDNVEPAVAAP